MRRVLTYISRPKGLSYGNFGDELTLPLLARLFGVVAVPTPLHKAQLIATGSLLDAHSRASRKRRMFNAAFSSRSPLHIWGSGFMLENTDFRWPRATIVHAVRGDLSMSRLSFGGAVGDPGILAAQLLEKWPSLDAEVALVPHFVDHSIAERLPLPSGWKIVHPDAPPLDVISRIASAETVVSSSLHGLIVADALGKPAVWAQCANGLFGNSTFKFQDHARARQQAFNNPLPYSRLIELTSGQLSELMTSPKRNIDEWSEALIRSFPFA